MTDVLVLSARHFDRDPVTNEVLWFSSPPMNVVQAVKPEHSLAYLHFLAMKSKREAGSVEECDETEVDGENGNGVRRAVHPLVSEMVRSIVVDLVKE